MDVHVDPIGGWSGDMFVAGLLDAFPEHWPTVERALAELDLGPDATARLVPHRDRAGLTGRRFLVRAEESRGSAAEGHHHHAPHHHGSHDHHHHDDVGQGHGHADDHRPVGTRAHPHRSWSSIRRLIEGSRLEPRVRREAVAIFTHLAEAEGQVHGVPPGEVTFHEVGSVDSIVDIVAAAQLIALVDAARWTASPLPLGSGRVRTAHGVLPVPAPATALLLRGIDAVDDGVPGERVTPTGAAVARHLLVGGGRATSSPRRLVRTGAGFGTRDLDGLSNMLRVLAFEPVTALDHEPPPATAASPASGFAHRELGVVTFEVDDLSAEELANGLDHIRAMAGVHDVVQGVVFGKKGRVATQVQVLVAPDRLDDAIRLCFAETTTIGLRFHIVRGAALARGFDTVAIDGHELRTKHVVRPDGTVTVKAEASDVAGEAGHVARQRLRRDAEAATLSRLGAEGEN